MISVVFVTLVFGDICLELGCLFRLQFCSVCQVSFSDRFSFTVVSQLFGGVQRISACFGCCSVVVCLSVCFGLFQCYDGFRCQFVLRLLFHCLFRLGVQFVSSDDQ